MTVPTATRRPTTAARLSGWRAALARAAALLLLLNIVLPLPAIAAATAAAGMVICTAEGMVHVPAEAAGDDGKDSHHSRAAGEHCPVCRISGAAPALPEPDFVLRTPQSIVETIARIGGSTPMPEPAHPPGSLTARAPPISI